LTFGFQEAFGFNGGHAACARRRDGLPVIAVLHVTGGFGITVIAGGIGTPQLRNQARAAGVELAHGRALPYDLDRGELAALVGGRVAVPTA